MKRQNVRTLALIVCTFTYLVLGAAVFDALESDMEGTEKERLQAQEREWQRRYNITAEDFEKITQLGIQLKPYRAGTQWKFAGAFYFATTVITTIGYGHCTPKTVGGKIFCMVYALPGIPLCLVMFQSIGERINTLITRLLRRLISLLNCKSRTVSQTHLIFVSANVVTIVLTAGAAVFAQYEKWHYLDAVYYCFITLTTIGFGDFVALQREDSLAKRPDYVAFSLIFILFGLTVVSSVMNLLVLRFLTMNTDDQRRDDLEAAAQAQELRRLHGDVIHSVIGMTSHLPPNCHDDAGEVTNPIKCKEISHVKEATSMKHQPAKYSYGEDVMVNQFHPIETHQSAVMLHVEKYFRSFARLFSHESHQNASPPAGNFLQSMEDRVSPTASYTESEIYDEEYSPWVSQSKEKTEREHGQHVFRFTDSCYKNLQKFKESKACIRADNVGCKTEVGNKAMVALQRNCEHETKSETYTDPNPDDCESPPRKCFRYASFDRASC
ncbi:Two pore potassium channel protein sup-9 [Taenia crassiceps]|uniref:Two pore potassium channel protein sup-9 n=1 Tax=Taenia crassiceps TaxID=6207 RepID=A0ABR4QEH8_9CEST